MNQRWRSESLGTVCSLINRGVSPVYAETGGVAVLNQRCVRDHRVNFELARRHNTYSKKVSLDRFLQAGDVLVNSTGEGTLGRVAQLRKAPPELATVDSHVTIVRPKDSLCVPEFFGYAMIAIEAQLQESGEGCGGQTELGRSKLANDFRISFPIDLAEQKRIVAILDEAFEGISAAAANAEKNLANARELFESYFNSILLGEGKGWAQRKLGDICENLDGKRIPITKSDRVAGVIPYYGASGVVDHVVGHLFDEDILLISEDGANLLARTYPIAFAVSGKCWVNNHAHVVRFKRTETQKWVEFYLNSISLSAYVSGMAQPKLNQKSLNSIPVPLPPMANQASLVDRIEAVQADSIRLETLYKAKLDKLAELKQTMLQKAFSGELTAATAKSMQPAAA